MATILGVCCLFINVQLKSRSNNRNVENTTELKLPVEHKRCFWASLHSGHTFQRTHNWGQPIVGVVCCDSHSPSREAIGIFGESVVGEPPAGRAAPSRLHRQKCNGLMMTLADLLSSAFKCAFTGLLYKPNELIFSKSNPLENDWLILKHFQLYSIIARYH